MPKMKTGHCLNGEHAGCPGGEHDEVGDYGQRYGDFTPCACSCHKAKCDSQKASPAGAQT